MQVSNDSKQREIEKYSGGKLNLEFFKLECNFKELKELDVEDFLRGFNAEINEEPESIQHESHINMHDFTFHHPPNSCDEIKIKKEEEIKMLIEEEEKVVIFDEVEDEEENDIIESSVDGIVVVSQDEFLEVGFLTYFFLIFKKQKLQFVHNFHFRKCSKRAIYPCHR